MITIVDSGVSNVRSVQNMLHRTGAVARITDQPDGLATATKVILPGVGSFDAGMRALRDRGLFDELQRVKARGIPILGICLGMQLLTEGSEEGRDSGLGWIPGACVRFSFDAPQPPLKVPHMGWNALQPQRSSRLLEGLDLDHRFYFVHSYHVQCSEPSDVIATSHYGRPFPAVIGRENVFGVQFHPEKSHRFGMWLLQRFVSL